MGDLVLMLVSAAALTLGEAQGSPAPGLDGPDFNNEVRPLLARRCLTCHGFDPSTRKSGLRLDTYDGAVTGGRSGTPAIVPGRADESELIRRIAAHDEERMPPAEMDPLSAEEIDLLRRWIDAGGGYAVHWSLRPVDDPAVPAVGDASWPRDDLDRFVLARLESAGLRPAPEADRATLLRRLSFDLVGLPPSPRELEAFLADDAPGAYERAVDRLLASPHFGERWGRHWLDLMRYAETHGHEFDYPIRHAWQYRDYVVRALNAGVPYDEFVTEHVAGDLLEPPRRHPTEGYDESVIGTGFWFLSQGTHSPVDSRADEAERIDNQIDVFSKAFLGATASCARCHDHKFDPITTREYYALAGYLQSSRRTEAYLDPHGAIADGLDRLAGLRAATRDAVDALVEDGLAADLAPLLAAAAEVAWGTPRPDDPPVPVAAVVLEDFEGDDYGAWAVHGTAFGSRPYTQETLAGYQGDVRAHGRGFVNTHNTRDKESVQGGDDHTGRLVGPEFVITHRFLHFLVGGGRHEARACVNLVVDGAVVRSATGHDSNELRPEAWDLRDLQGRIAHVEIVDEVTGSWGQIGADHFVLADETVVREPMARPIGTVIAEMGLPIDDVTERRVVACVDALRSAVEGEAPAPVRAFVAAAQGSEPERVGSLASEPAMDEQVIEDFRAGIAGWFPSGFAWSGPSAGDLVRSTSGVEPAAVGIASSRGASLRAQGTLRSPTFEIREETITYRVRGRGGRIRLIVDGYVLDEFNALLFDGFTFPVDTNDAWEIHTQRTPRVVGHRAWIELHDEGGGYLEVDWIRFGPEPRAAIPSTAAEADAAALAERFRDALAAWRDGTADAADAALVGWLLRHEVLGEPDARARLAAAEAAERDADTALPPPMRVLAIEDGTPEDEYVFVRGSHRQRGEDAHRQFLAAFGGGPPADPASGSGRLDLARQLLAEGNPRPARTLVNRVWHHLFGRGLSGTTDDLGTLGEPPTHPQLLDHLATWIRHDARWSLKALVRRIVCSASYRMAATGADPAAEEIDPANRLLHRARVRRLEGEAIRDAVLAVSGRLEPALGGEPVPIHLTPFMEGRGRPGRSGPLDGAGRRSIYLEVRRNFLSPMMLTFDAPVPHSTVGKRTVSNVPAQSLTMMNDPFVAGQAGLWAERILADAELASDTARIERMYLEAFARRATADETARILDFLATAEGDADARWKALAHALYNTKEFIYVP